MKPRMEKSSMKILDGQKITEVATINSMYANGYVTVKANGKWYRMHVKVILQMLNEFVFDVDKKRLYEHIVGVRWDDTIERLAKEAM